MEQWLSGISARRRFAMLRSDSLQEWQSSRSIGIYGVNVLHNGACTREIGVRSVALANGVMCFHSYPEGRDLALSGTTIVCRCWPVNSSLFQACCTALTPTDPWQSPRFVTDSWFVTIWSGCRRRAAKSIQEALRYE